MQKQEKRKVLERSREECVEMKEVRREGRKERMVEGTEAE
jgi:hypothetical protein